MSSQASEIAASPLMLAVSFAFPPLTYPRAAQVARLLKHSSVRTILVCADEANAAKDSSVHADADVFACLRVPFAISPLRRTINHVTHRFHRPLWNRLNVEPDRYGPWKPAVLAAIEKYLRQTTASPHVITTFSHPLSDHLIGLELKARYRRPWIAHFSDPWADNPYLRTDARSRERNLKLEHAVVKNADRLIFTSAETVDLVMDKYPGEWKSKVRVLPHSFESSQPRDTRTPPDSKIIVRYVGSFYGNRTPAPLFKTLEALCASDPGLMDEVRVELIGTMDHATIRDAGFDRLKEGLVTVHPQVPYMESLSLIGSADGLLIIDAPATVSVFLPSKLIECIGTGRPIFGFTPPGGSAKLIKELSGWVSDPQPAATATAFRDFLLFLRANRNDKSPWGDPNIRRRYEATRVAEMFDEIVAETQRNQS